MSGSVPQVGWTRVPRLLLAGCAAVVAMCAAWAAWPIAVEPVPVSAGAAVVTERPATTIAALDLDAFRVPVWVAPTPPPAPEKPALPPPPLKLQLLAIIREGESYKAALYDPDADKVLVVAAGETLGAGRAVEAVTATAVSVRDAGGRGVRTLALRDEGKP